MDAEKPTAIKSEHGTTYVNHVYNRKTMAYEPQAHSPLERLRHHVTGAIERGEATPIVEQKAPKSELEQWITDKAQEYAKLEAQAAQLAEALSLAQATIERLTLKYDIENVWGTLDMTQKALAAYEAAR